MLLHFILHRNTQNTTGINKVLQHSIRSWYINVVVLWKHQTKLLRAARNRLPRILTELKVVVNGVHVCLWSINTWPVNI